LLFPTDNESASANLEIDIQSKSTRGVFMKALSLVIGGILLLSGTAAFAEDAKPAAPADTTQEKKVGSGDTDKVAETKPTSPTPAPEQKSGDASKTQPQK
jgi:hypothetical protein